MKMRKKVLQFVSLIFVSALIVGCATLAQKARETTGVPVTGGVKSIVIQGPSRVKVGETVTLKAIGYDAKQARIKIPGIVKPNWSVDDPKVGKLDKTKGASVKFTGLTPGVCYIKAVQGEAKAETAIEVK
ncbi:MAG: hypothetical protein DRI36_03020 [Caldiserica bacterium]|nr:MAG: hypothetical protein DRI36_03020 [Caldisericota bacterium]